MVYVTIKKKKIAVADLWLFKSGLETLKTFKQKKYTLCPAKKKYIYYEQIKRVDQRNIQTSREDTFSIRRIIGRITTWSC